MSAVPRPTAELPSQGPLPCACHDGMDFLANGIFIFSLAPLIISVRETPPATRLPSILRGRRATPELRPCPTRCCGTRSTRAVSGQWQEALRAMLPTARRSWQAATSRAAMISFAAVPAVREFLLATRLRTNDDSPSRARPFADRGQEAARCRAPAPREAVSIRSRWSESPSRVPGTIRCRTLAPTPARARSAR